MAARPRTPTRRASSHPPLWLVEGADIVRRKTVLLGIVAGAVVLVVALVSLLAPGVVPPTAPVGAAVGLAALLMGLAAAVTSDAADLVVRGPRHIAAAGGELVAVLPRDPSVAAAGPLAQAVLEVRQPDAPLLLSFASAGRDARRSAAWTSALARALLAEGVSVLRLDLSSGRSDTPGLVEVIHDGRRLAEVVSFEPGVKLAELTAGRDHAQALDALTELPARLPRDLDILLVALPSATARTVVSAAASLDHVLVVAERDRTSRVDLIASLEALEAAGTHAQVILLDTPTSTWLAPPVVVPATSEQERPSGLASTIGAAPVLLEGSDGEPVPVPEDEGEGEDDADDPAGVEHREAADEAGDSDRTEVVSEGDSDRTEVVSEGDSDGTEVVSEGDSDTGPILPVGDHLDGEQHLRDTAVLDAAAAATALSIAASEQGLTREQQELGAPGIPADAAASDAEEPVLEPIEGPVDQPAPDPVPDQEPVIELDPDAGDRPDEPFSADMEMDVAQVDAASADHGETPSQRHADDVLDGGASDRDTTDDGLSDSDPTDRLAPVRDVGPLAGGDLDAQDLLRTTAQLAILTEDMQARLRAEGDGPEADEG